MSEPRIVEVRRDVLRQNDLLARELRRRFRGAGLHTVSLVSSPGAGKTTLLELLLTELGRRARVAALVGDLATENDARRLERSGAPVRQITTGTVCHLDAAMIERALAEWDIGALDYLFIENVGNLVCPAAFDLGEELRLVLISTTEGEDKPLKYPPIFHGADVAVITKLDLAGPAEVKLEELVGNIQAVRPGIPVLPVSSRTGAGLPALLELLITVRERARAESA